MTISHRKGVLLDGVGAELVRATSGGLRKTLSAWVNLIANLSGQISAAWANVIQSASLAAGQALIDAGNPFTDVASAATVDLGAVASDKVRITGTTGPITSFGTAAAGIVKRVRVASTPSITYNATSMILPGDASIACTADDEFDAVSLGSGNWYVGTYQRGAGVPTAISAAVQPALEAATLKASADLYDIGNAYYDVASASEVDLGSAGVGQKVNITGNTTITSFGATGAGKRRLIRFNEAITVEHSADIVLPNGGVDMLMAAGDHLEAVSMGAGVWRCFNASPAQMVVNYPLPSPHNGQRMFVIADGAEIGEVDGSTARNNFVFPFAVFPGARKAYTGGMRFIDPGDTGDLVGIILDGTFASPTGWTIPFPGVRFYGEPRNSDGGAATTNFTTGPTANYYTMIGWNAGVYLPITGAPSATNRQGAFVITTTPQNYVSPFQVAWASDQQNFVIGGRETYIGHAHDYDFISLGLARYEHDAPSQRANWYATPGKGALHIVAPDEANNNCLSIRKSTDVNRGLDVAMNHADNQVILRAVNSGTPSAIGLFDIDGDYTSWSQPFLNSAQPGFHAIPSADASNVTGDGTAYTVIFGTEISDPGADFNAGTGVFTAPIGGRYLLATRIGLEGLASGHDRHILTIVTSNRTYGGDCGDLPLDSVTRSHFSFSVVADMDAGDTAFVEVKVIGATKVVAVKSESHFSGHLLG